MNLTLAINPLEITNEHWPHLHDVIDIAGKVDHSFAKRSAHRYCVSTSSLQLRKAHRSITVDSEFDDRRRYLGNEIKQCMCRY